MPNDNNINLKRLPQASEINYGDFLLLETSQGTNVIDFKDFIITEYNTTFYPLISSNSEDIRQIYSSTGSLIRTLSANVAGLSGQWYSNFTDRIASNSAVGIKTDQPVAALTVNGDISASGGLSAHGGPLGSPSYFQTNVGIGTTAPILPLDVRNMNGERVLRLVSKAANDCQMEIWSNAGITDCSGWGFESANIGVFRIAESTATMAASDPNTWTTRFIILEGGNVGIGTQDNYGDDARARLHVVGGSENTIGKFESNGEICLVGMTNSRSGAFEGIGSWQDRLVLYTNNEIRMRIDSSGHVGIGDTDPNSILTVGGEISIKEVTSTPATTTNYGKIYTRSDNKLYFQDGDGVSHEISYA